MKLSTRTRYGMRAIIELAQHEGKRPLQLRTIADRQGISVKYLEQLMSLLRSAGFVRSVRGSKGGYILARPAGEIPLSEVFRCLEGAVTTTECTEDEDYCKRSADCVARELWIEVEAAIHHVLSSVSLADMVKKAKTHSSEYQI
ncbi:MAG: Rrf2 family transcriptional regulator [Planctomycetes bacterium]|jgi:Rrf2 family protein|nr:Rrf2 family transcriptional regulator [Planctomycetota bacterium]